jgi:hypothetical protein
MTAVTAVLAPLIASRPERLPAPVRRVEREPERPWLDPQVIALSFQRADGEWHYCPWMTEGRDDLYAAR